MAYETIPPSSTGVTVVTTAPITGNGSAGNPINISPSSAATAGTMSIADFNKLASIPAGSSILIGATWTLGAANRRLYLVDGVNGNDANIGYLDGGSANFPISGATVAATARKTLGALDAIFPRIGNGRHVEIIIANGGVNTVGTYADALETFLQGYEGYTANCPLVRGTGTNTTAGATAFAGDLADNTYQGEITVTGLNVAGYTPAGVPTNQVVQCTKVGGAAPAFPAEPLAPVGWRIRFDSATTTAALRNICRTVSVVTTDTITTATTLPAVPVLTDTFYLEQSGWTFPVSVLQGGGNFSGGTGGGRGLQIVGGRCTGNITCNGIALNLTSSGCVNLGPGGGYVNCSDAFQSMTLGSITVGGACHMTGNFSSVLGGCYSLRSTVTEGLVQAIEPVQFNWKVGSVAGTGILFHGAVATDSVGVNSIGSESGQLVSRILGSSATVGAGLHVGSGVVLAAGIDITGCGTRPGLLIDRGALVHQLQSTILSGTTGNNDVGLAFVTAASTVPQGFSNYNSNSAVNTLTGALGDIRVSNLLSAGQIVTWAQVNATGLWDARGNRIVGSVGCGPLARITFSGAIDTAPGGATIAYLADDGGTTPNQGAKRYPTSLMLALRLRVTKLVGAGVVTNNVTCTLYQNGAPTTMTVTILAADAAFTKYVDSAHPILFSDGDDFDLRLDDAADVLGGVLPVSGSLEYAA